MYTFLIALLFSSANVHAVPAQFTHQGRLLDGDGVPLEGDATMTFRVVDSATGGAVLWEEPLLVVLNNGFFSAVLGASEEDNPLDTEVLSQAPVWLELQLDGEPAMFPRTAIHSVPYATMATVAEEVAGGPVDATEVAIDGTVVIDASGEWTGPAAPTSWDRVADIPAGFADGTDDDTVLTEEEVDTMTSDNGYAMAADLFSGGFEDLSGIPTGLSDGDTVLTEDEVDTMTSDNGYAMATDLFSGSWSDLVGVPEGLDDGDDDTDSLSALSVSCVANGVPKWDVLLEEWSCTDDNDALSDLPCIDGDVAAWSDAADSWVCTEKADTDAVVPTGAIMMWSGTSAPEGWALCDGSSGTPDLRDRFIVASGPDHTPGDAGDASISLGVSTTSVTVGAAHGPSWATTAVNSVSASNPKPRYYALAFIMKI